MGRNSRSLKTFRNLMLLAGMPSQIPERDAVASWVR